MSKIYVTPDEMFKDSFSLAEKLYNDNIRPSVILTVWRGGAIPGLCIGEYYKFRGIHTKDMVIKAVSYTDDHTKKKCCDLLFYSNLHEINDTDHVLIVDDVFDTGETILMVREAVSNYTQHITFATLWYKPDNRRVEYYPRYHIHKVEGDPWIVYPHEVPDLLPNISGGLDQQSSSNTR